MKDMFMHHYILDKKGNPVIEPNLQDRCSGSREQAEAMHQKMVKLVKEKYGNRQRKPKLKNKAR